METMTTTILECVACRGEGHPADAGGTRSACSRCGGGGWEPETARMLRNAHVESLAEVLATTDRLVAELEAQRDEARRLEAVELADWLAPRLDCSAELFGDLVVLLTSNPLATIADLRELVEADRRRRESNPAQLELPPEVA